MHRVSGRLVSVLNRMLVRSQAPPTPVDSHVTRWTQNDLTRGSYSYVKTFVSASNDAPQQIPLLIMPVIRSSSGPVSERICLSVASSLLG